jgi:hypothetical protein
MHSVFIFLFLCALAVLVWWILRDEDRFLDEGEEGVRDDEKAEEIEDQDVVETIIEWSD